MIPKSVRAARKKLGRVFSQRCLYLLLALVVLIFVAQVLQAGAHARIVFNALHLLVLISAIAAVGHSTTSFVLAALLAVPILIFQALGIYDDDITKLFISWSFGVAFYLLTLGYLLGYVFREDVITTDKLYGAAAAYLMLAVLWTYGYNLAQGGVAGAFAAGGDADRVLGFVELLYFSITVLTSTGFGDIAPLSPLARALVTLEEIVGVLFVAILIARLAGIYPPRTRRS